MSHSLDFNGDGVIQEDERQFDVLDWNISWSRDSERYLRHYAADFRTGSMDRSSFASHKRRVNASKKYIRVDLDQVGIYGYPGEPDLALVDFQQSYESDNFRASRRKHQYWRRDSGRERIAYHPGGAERWRIVYETGL